MRLAYSALLLFCVFASAYSAKILGVFLTPSISHQLVYQPVWKELALRGHNVTVITTDPLKDPSLKNLKEIDLHASYEFLENFRKAHGRITKNMGILKEYLALYIAMQYITEDQLSKSEVLDILNDEDAAYDLLIIECFPPVAYVFAARFHNTPFVCIFSGAGLTNLHDAIGNPTHALITPEPTISLNIEFFYDRFLSAYANVLYRLLYRYFILPRADSAVRKYVKYDIPYLGDVEKNVSIVMLNSNLVLNPIRPNLPSVVELGLMHIKPKKPLPEASI